MKSIKLMIVAALALFSMFAQAGEVTFKATDGQVFGTGNVYMYTMNAGNGASVLVSTLHGADNLFADGGSLAGRILQSQTQLVNVTGTNSYVDPTYAIRVTCINGDSVVYFPTGGTQQVRASDNCSMFQQIQSKAK